MGKRNIHILIEKFFENDLSPEIQKKFHAWLLDRNFQEEKEKAMVTLWEEKSAVANESTFQELSPPLLLNSMITVYAEAERKRADEQSSTGRKHLAKILSLDAKP